MALEIERETLDADQAARLLGVNRATLYANLIGRPGFPSLKIGRRRVFPRRLLLAWLEHEATQHDTAAP